MSEAKLLEMMRIFNTMTSDQKKKLMAFIAK